MKMGIHQSWNDQTTIEHDTLGLLTRQSVNRVAFTDSHNLARFDSNGLGLWFLIIQGADIAVQ